MADKHFRQIGRDWCKKEEVPIENSLLIVCPLNESELEVFGLALLDKIPTLTEVHRRDQDGK